MGKPQLPDGVVSVVADMQVRLVDLPPGSGLREFLATYQRTTAAVGRAIVDGAFEDPVWVEDWDVAFARLYLAAFDAYVEAGGALGAPVPRPWRLAFEAPADIPALRQVLLGVNAHVNYDLPQALLAVITDEEFADPARLAVRQRDHETIDGVLSSRVAAEGAELNAVSKRNLLDRLLQPLNRWASRRFLKEAREKVWHNTHELQCARVGGPELYDARLAELELLSAARVADLLAPGQVLLRLAVAGFGVVLPPAA